MTTSQVSRPHPKLSVQAFWLTFSKFIAALFSILIPILLVRILSQHEYGVYKQVFLFVGTATNLAAFSVAVSAFYYMPRHPERGGQIVLNILLYNLAAGLIPLLLLLFYPKALNLVFRSGDLQRFALLLGIYVMLLMNATLVETIPVALQDVRNSTIFVVGTQLARLILLLLAAVIFETVRSLILASILAAALSVVVLISYLYQRFGPFWKHFDASFFREQLAYALPLGAYGIVWVIRRDLDNYFVSAMYDPAEYAIYALGWLEVPLISLFLESMLSVLVVRVSALQKEGNAGEIKRVMASAINRVSTIQFPIYAMLLVAGRDLIVFFYTKTYERSVPIFDITITLIVLNVFIYDPLVRAYKELRGFIVGVRVAVLIVLCVVLAPIIRHYGMIGAALTGVIGDLTERIIVGWKAYRTVGATPRDIFLIADVLRVAAVTAVAALVAYGVRIAMLSQPMFLRLAATGLSFALVYVTGFYFWRLPGWEMLSRERLLQLLRTARAKLGGATT